MTGYCDQCERHCPLDALECGRGRRMVGQSEKGERREERCMRGQHDHGQRGGRGSRSGHESYKEHEFYDRKGRTFHDGERDHHDHDAHAFHDSERDHHEREGRTFHDGERDHHDREGHTFRDDHRGHHGAEGRGARGRGPSREELLQRLETGDLSELMHISGHMLRSPRSGAASGQGRVMAILAQRGAISQRELQELLHVQPGSVSEILRKLEDKGLLTRARGEDRRGNILTITEDGRAFAESLNADEDLFAALDPSEQEQLRSLLKKLLTDWMRRFE